MIFLADNLSQFNTADVLLGVISFLLALVVLMGKTYYSDWRGRYEVEKKEQKERYEKTDELLQKLTENDIKHEMRLSTIETFIAQFSTNKHK